MKDSELNSKIQSLIQSGRKMKNIGSFRDHDEKSYRSIPIKQANFVSSLQELGDKSPVIRNINLPVRLKMG